MKQASYDKYDRAIKSIAEGSSLAEAVAKEKMSTDTYYRVKKEKEKSPSQIVIPMKRKYKTRALKSSFVDVPLKTTHSTNVAVVVCQIDQLMKVLAGLQ